jgi:hypothetical protein
VKQGALQLRKGRVSHTGIELPVPSKEHTLSVNLRSPIPLVAVVESKLISNLLLSNYMTRNTPIVMKIRDKITMYLFAMKIHFDVLLDVFRNCNSSGNSKIASYNKMTNPEAGR